MKELLFILLVLASAAKAEVIRNPQTIDVLPADYGKFGITPFVGQISDNGTQQTTLIFNKSMQNKPVAKVVLYFFSNKKMLILKSEGSYECKSDKCFVVFDITPDYQNNIEIELIYSQELAEGQQTSYRVKDIGLLTGRLNRKR